MTTTTTTSPGALARSLARDLADDRGELCPQAPHGLGAELRCPACRDSVLRRRGDLSMVRVLDVLQGAPELIRIAASNRVAVLAVCLWPEILGVDLGDPFGFVGLADVVDRLGDDLTRAERAAVGEVAELLVVATSTADVRAKRDAR